MHLSFHSVRHRFCPDLKQVLKQVGRSHLRTWHGKRHFYSTSVRSLLVFLLFVPAGSIQAVPSHFCSAQVWRTKQSLKFGAYPRRHFFQCQSFSLPSQWRPDGLGSYSQPLLPIAGVEENKLLNGCAQLVVPEDIFLRAIIFLPFQWRPDVLGRVLSRTILK